MATEQLKEKLHEYIDTADEKKLEAIYTILQDTIEDDQQYSADELAVFYNRRQEYKNGEGENLTVEEFINFVRKNKA
jgi:F0F1-type ATP synthase gamma subunit